MVDCIGSVSKFRVFKKNKHFSNPKRRKNHQIDRQIDQIDHPINDHPINDHPIEIEIEIDDDLIEYRIFN